VALALIYFPAIFHHLTGYRGREALSNFEQSERLTDMLPTMLQYVNKEILGFPDAAARCVAFLGSGLFSAILIILIGLLFLIIIGCIVFLWHRRKGKLNEISRELKVRIIAIFDVLKIDVHMCLAVINKYYLIITLSIATIGSLLVISKIAPFYTNYSDRYIFFLYPFICLIVIVAASWIQKKVLPRAGDAVLLVLVMIFAAGTHLVNEGQYSFAERPECKAFREKVIDADCIFVTEHDYMLHSMSNLFMTSNSVYPTRPQNLDQIVDGVLSAPKGVSKVLLIIPDNYYCEKDILNQINEDTGFHATLFFRGIASSYMYNIYKITT
jgi:hypothetical protein